jgi:hypothetical protein
MKRETESLAMQKIGVSLCLLLLAPLIASADPPANQTAGSRRPNPDDYKLAEKWRVARLKAIKDQPALADTWRPATTVPLPPLDSPLTVGDLGTLRGYRFRVIKRLGKSEARVGILAPPAPSEAGHPKRPNEPLVEVEALLRGFDLSKVADGQEVKTQSCFIVNKPDTDRAAHARSHSLLVIEPFESIYAQMIFENAVGEEAAEARDRANDPDGTKGDRKAAQMLERMARRQHAAALRYPALLANARHLIAARHYPAAEKMLRRIVDETPASDVAIQAQKELDGLPAH